MTFIAAWLLIVLSTCNYSFCDGIFGLAKGAGPSLIPESFWRLQQLRGYETHFGIKRVVLIFPSYQSCEQVFVVKSHDL